MRSTIMFLTNCLFRITNVSERQYYDSKKGKETRKKNEKEYLFLIIITSIILIAILLLSTRSCSKGEMKYSGVKWNGNQQVLTHSCEQKYIAVQGIMDMHFTANTLEQTVNFYNPKENECLMSIKIVADGHGTIFEKENIQPDYGLYAIRLNQELDAGIYNANVIMAFTTLDGQTKLNSGNFRTKIIVGE